MNLRRMFFVQTTRVLPPKNMHRRLTEHERCSQNNQILTRSLVELVDNSSGHLCPTVIIRLPSSVQISKTVDFFNCHQVRDLLELISEMKFNGVCRRDWIHSSGCDSRGNSAINRERNTRPYAGHATRESQGNFFF